MTTVTCAQVWVFDLGPLSYISVFVPVPYSLYYCGSVTCLIIWNGNPFSIVLFTQIVVAIWSLFCSCINFKIMLSIFEKSEVGILMWIELKCEHLLVNWSFCDSNSINP